MTARRGVATQVCSLCGVRLARRLSTGGGTDSPRRCPACEKLEAQAFARGGTEAVRALREAMRGAWDH